MTAFCGVSDNDWKIRAPRYMNPSIVPDRFIREAKAERSIAGGFWKNLRTRCVSSGKLLLWVDYGFRKVKILTFAQDKRQIAFPH
jgi:hypothetical protein